MLFRLKKGEKIIEFNPIVSCSEGNGKKICTARIEISTVGDGFFTIGYWQAFCNKETSEDDFWVPNSKKFKNVKERLDTMLRNFLEGLADTGSPENPFTDTFVTFWEGDETRLQEALQECVGSDGLNNWDNVPIGTPVMVKNSVDGPWVCAKFIGIADDGNFEVSFLYTSPADTHYYKYAKYILE